jgi:hypothetical protein
MRERFEVRCERMEESAMKTKRPDSKLAKTKGRLNSVLDHLILSAHQFGGGDHSVLRIGSSKETVLHRKLGKFLTGTVWNSVERDIGINVDSSPYDRAAREKNKRMRVFDNLWDNQDNPLFCDTARFGLRRYRLHHYEGEHVPVSTVTRDHDIAGYCELYHYLRVVAGTWQPQRAQVVALGSHFGTGQIHYILGEVTQRYIIIQPVCFLSEPIGPEYFFLVLSKANQK